MRRTSGSLAPALARTRATSGRPHRRAAVSDVNRRVVILLRIVARRVVVGVVVGGGVVRIIISRPRASCGRARRANRTQTRTRPTPSDRSTSTDGRKENASERPSVRRAGRRCDDVVVSSPRALTHSIPFHSTPCTRTDRSMGASASFFTYLVFEDGVYGEDGWVVCVP